MLIGVLSGQSLAEYSALVRTAPVQFIVPPILWLSAPHEPVDPEIKLHLAADETDVTVQMKTAMFRHLLNPETGIPGFYAAVVPVEGSIAELRHRLGVADSPDPFIPSMLLVHDGLRSKSVKTFCRSVSDVLARYTLTFTLTIANPDNPDHVPLFENYNPETQEVFGPAVSYQ